MAQQDIKQIRGASQGSILFLGTNSIVSEDFNNLNWNQSNNILYVNGNLQIVDGNQQTGYVLTTDSNGLATWSASQVGITSLNGITQSLQYFTASNDTNVKLNIDSSGSTHSYELSWDGLLPLSRGGLSNSTFTASQILTVNSTTSSVVSSGYRFNDSGTSSTDIWSANKTIEYISSLTLSGARANNNATNVYLRYGDGLPFNTTPFVLPYDGIIKHISISSGASSTWTGEVRNNGTLITGASLTSTAQTATYSSYNISVNAGDLLQLYANGTAINNPRMVVIIQKR